MKRSTLALCLAASAALCGRLHAAPLTAAAPAAEGQAVAQETPHDFLGVQFENQSAGLSLRIPAGCHRVRTTGSGDDLGQFADERRNWQLKLNRIIRQEPTLLTTTTNNFGQPIVGLLDSTVQRLKHDLPGCQILRSDVTNISDGSEKLRDNVGMIAVRYAATGGSRYLSQQAIIQSTDRLFYLIALTSPYSSRAPADADNDPAERTAVETFRQLLDSVHLLDTTKIYQDQSARLWRTKNLMMSWGASNRLASVLVDEQWIRILRNGKDIGYSYVTEQTAAGIPRPLKREEVLAGKSDRDLVQPGDGILIGVRARTMDPDANVDPSLKAKGPVQVDSATWMFTAPDRRLEDWSRVIVVDAGNKDKDGKPIKVQTEEFGTSNKTIIRKLDKNGIPGTAIDPHQPPVRIQEQYVLNVTTVSQSAQGEPLDQEVAPWYIPQALGHLLPRLVPLRPEMDPDLGTIKPRTYMFAVYVPELREVMNRYIDVKNEQEVTFAGRKIMAVPVEDRLGWQGSLTTHYLTRGGTYLGSENKEAHLVMLPSDAKTLLAIWKNADLSRPGGTERPRNTFQGLPLGSSSAGAPIGPQELQTK
jgi:hypothetical protein